MIERFYDPSDGVLEYCGTDIKLLNVHWYRDQIGFVGQVRRRMGVSDVMQCVLPNHFCFCHLTGANAVQRHNRSQYCLWVPQRHSTRDRRGCYASKCPQFHHILPRRIQHSWYVSVIEFGNEFDCFTNSDISHVSLQLDHVADSYLVVKSNE